MLGELRFLGMFDVHYLLPVDCSAFGVKVKASKILHNSVGWSVFSGRAFGAREIVVYYYRALLCTSLTTK